MLLSITILFDYHKIKLIWCPSDPIFTFGFRKIDPKGLNNDTVLEASVYTTLYYRTLSSKNCLSIAYFHFMFPILKLGKVKKAN